MNIGEFKEFREKRKAAVDAYHSNARKLIRLMDKADTITDPREKLGLLAPAYDESVRVYRDYAVFDRSLGLPGGIADKCPGKLGSYIKTALSRNVAAGLPGPGNVKAEEMELLRELATPKDFLSFESTKLLGAAHVGTTTTTIENKKRQEARHFYAEEPVLSGLGKEKRGFIFRGVLTALDGIIKYDALEDPDSRICRQSHDNP